MRMQHDDFLKRSEALSRLTGKARCVNSPGKVRAFATAINVIETMPAADVELVRHGQYIGTEFDGYADGNPVYYEWKCSECNCVFEDDEPKYRYCPNCGAKMDGEA